MTYTPYNDFNNDEEAARIAEQSLQERSELEQSVQQTQVDQQAQQAEVEQEAMANPEGTPEGEQPAATTEEPKQEEATPAPEGEVQPGDTGTNPNQPPEGDEDLYKWNPAVGEYEMKSGAMVQKLGETVFAPAAGTLDGFVDTYNYFMPGPDIPKLPKFRDTNLENIRTVSSYIGPTLLGQGLITKGAKALHATGKAGPWMQKLGNNPAFKWFANLGLDMGVGGVVDQANSHSTGDNLQGELRKALKTPEGERLFGIFPSDWATNPNNTPDENRAKNRNEGFGLGWLTGIAQGLGEVVSASSSVRRSTQYLAKDDSAAAYFAKRQGDEFSNTKYSDDPIEDAVARSEARTQHNLDELGEFYVAKYNEQALAKGEPFQTADEIPFEGPVKGIHDSFDWSETGVRNADPDGVPGAMVDAARIQGNIGTRHGRLGSIVTEAALKYGLDVDSLQKGQLVTLVMDSIEQSGKFDALINDKIVSAKQIDEAGTFLAEVMEEMEPGQMQQLLGEFKKMNDDLNIQVVNKVGYDGVFKALKKYQDTFLNLNEKKARALLTTSLAGQASDMSLAMKELDGSAAVEAARTMIFDRMEYLMVEKALASYDAGSTLQSLNVWKRMKAMSDPNGAAKDFTLQQVEAREKFLGTLVPKVKGFTANLLAIAEEKPHFLVPLFDAYNMLDGDVTSMYRLNNYVYESLGAIQQAFIKGEDTMPNLIVQGFYGNYYNSILSATATPIRAWVGNIGGLIARPINTMVGAMASGDLKAMHRAGVQYAGFVSAMQEGFAHMGHYYKKTRENPMSTMSYGKGDLIIQENEAQMHVLRQFAEAAKKDGEYGPEFMVNMYQAQFDQAMNPFLRYSAEMMGAGDAFVRAFVGVAEARGRAFDQLLTPGKRMMPKDFKKATKKAYKDMVDSKGFITDTANDYFSKEIALNLDSELSRGISEMIAKNPALKPFIMFPKTSINILSMFQAYSPLAAISKDFWDVVGYPSMDQVPMEHIQKVLTRKGIAFDENAVNVFKQMRYEAKGRLAVGSASIAGASALFMQDRLRGNGHWDKERQRVRTDNNWAPKTYKGLDGKWHSYEWLGPLGDWLAVTADVMDNFDGISTAAHENMTEKLMYIMAASITNRSVMAQIEPLNDVLSGNGAAMNRWGANFINGAMGPLGGMRNQMSRLLSDGLKEVDSELVSLLRNKNNYVDALNPEGALGPKYDWVDHEIVGQVEGFHQRLWNVVTGQRMAEKLTPNKQFLIDIEYDSRPTFMKGEEGIPYTDKQRSALYDEMGEQGYFAHQLNIIRKDAERAGWMDKLREFRDKGVGSTAATGGVAADKYLGVYDRIDVALRIAMKRAEAALSSREIELMDQRAAAKRMNDGMSRRGTLTTENMYK